MIRKILCEECDKSTGPWHPEDVAAGWKRRRVQIRTKKPPVHDITVITERGKHITQLDTLHCDICNAPLPDGTAAFALTEWQKHREDEPWPWEKGFSEDQAPNL